MKRGRGGWGAFRDRRQRKKGAVERKDLNLKRQRERKDFRHTRQHFYCYRSSFQNASSVSQWNLVSSSLRLSIVLRIVMEFNTRSGLSEVHSLLFCIVILLSW